MLHVQDATGSVSEVVARLEAAVTANKFGVLGVIDLKAKMAAKGVNLGPECRILEVCNPVQAKAVLDADMAISTVLPCRICVYEDKGKVKVATLKPTAVLGLFNKPQLAPVAQAVEDALVRIINTACQ